MRSRPGAYLPMFNKSKSHTMSYYKGYKYTIEHINDTDVIVRIYKSGKFLHKFSVCDFGDWNEVEGQIQRQIDLSK